MREEVPIKNTLRPRFKELDLFPSFLKPFVSRMKLQEITEDYAEKSYEFIFTKDVLNEAH